VVGVGAVASGRSAGIALRSALSNVHAGPFPPSKSTLGLLHRAGFAVTLNTDNRLMSDTR
jgi:adenosine deaminase